MFCLTPDGFLTLVSFSDTLSHRRYGKDAQICRDSRKKGYGVTDAKAPFIGFGFAMVPYMAVAWAYTYFSEGGQPLFWRVLGSLLVVRIFFSIIESVGSYLAWRFFVRQQMVARLVGIFQANRFPAKQYSEDDFADYCARLFEDQPRKQLTYLEYAQEIQSFLLVQEKRGIIDGLRVHSVVDAAFSQYMAMLPKITKSRLDTD
jgi:hypothetical protein